MLPRNGGNSYGAGRGPDRGRRSGEGGVEIGEGGGRGQRASAKGREPRWSPGDRVSDREKLAK